MTYRDTARAFTRAESIAPNGRPDNPQALAAAKLPMSEWAEARRDFLSPATIAANHALHVSDTAHALREADQAAPAFDPASPEGKFRTAARALLAAIGEGESA